MGMGLILSRLKSVFAATLFSWVLLFTTTAQCQCHSSFSERSPHTNSQKETPCGAHDKGNRNKSQPSDGNCCCSLKAASYFPESNVLTNLALAYVITIEFIPAAEVPYLTRLASASDSDSRGSPGWLNSFYSVLSSSSLSIRFQRWII